MKAPPLLTYAFGDFRLDLEERRLLGPEGGEVPLTPRVFETLRYLVEHPGRVAEKEALMKAVWPDCIVEENNLAQNISTLRRLLGDKNGTQRYIATVPGRGYRFVAKVETADRADTVVAGVGDPGQAATIAAPPGSAIPATTPTWSRSVVMLAVLLLGAGAVYWWQSSRPRMAVLEKSIAVLPFENLSADPENAFFVEGIKDEILTRLSKIAALKVISRTSTEEFAGKKQNLKEIGQRLGVAYFLEGSVQRSGERVRITVQLIDAGTDHHLWAEMYERPLLNLFEVESDVAEKVAAALHIRLAGGERREASSLGTKSREAYEAYLRGLTAEQWFDYDSWQRAIAALEEAVRADPNFAKAWALLGRVRARTCFQGLDTTEAARVAAKEATETALRLAPELIEAQIARGFYEYYIADDYEKARRTFEEVQAQWHNNGDVVAALGFIAFRQGRWSDGRQLIDEAIVLSPRDCYLRGEAAYTRACVRDFAGALRAFDQARAVCADEPNLIGGEAAVYQVMGDLDQADALLRGLHPKTKDMAAVVAICNQAMLRRDPAAAITLLRASRESSDSLPLLVQARYCVLLGQLETLSGDATAAKTSFVQARELLERELARQPDNALPVCLLAQTLAGLGDSQAALHEADRAMQIFPSDRDARDGPYYEAMRARLQARFGDGDRAIPALKRLLKTSYSAWPGSLLTPAVLRLDPDFDKLRNDPRFQELCR